MRKEHSEIIKRLYVLSAIHYAKSGGFLFDFINGGVEFQEFPLDLLWKIHLEIEDLFSEKG
jgi:hypothetical protein